MTDSDKIIVCALTGFLILIAGLAVLKIDAKQPCRAAVECAAYFQEVAQ